jgi:hypothetical protein
MKVGHSHGPGAVDASKTSRSGGEIGFGMNVSKLQAELAKAGKEGLKAHSYIELFEHGANKFTLSTDDSIEPDCPHQDLPMSNEALLKTLKCISEFKAFGPNSTIALLTGDVHPPDIYQIKITSKDDGPVYPFMVDTGLLMGNGKLTY